MATLSGDSGSSTFSYTGTLPTGVSFDTTTGTFTGPATWNFQVVQIAAGNSSTCAVTTAGGVKCWGWNLFGQLGDGTTTNRTTPVDVSGLTSGVAQVVAGGIHACALTTSGGVKCWGYNDLGQIGDGTDMQRNTPVDVSGLTSGVTSISSNGYHTCALTTSGGAKCWGSNGDGQLGDGTTTNRTTPVDVSGLTSGVSQIAASSGYTCAVTTSGGAKCWGSNENGRLGDGTTTRRLAPVDVSDLTSGVASIAVGGHTCAVTTSGGAKCWGSNAGGQIGDGTTTRRLAPVDVSGLTSGVASISVAANTHTCAVTTSGGAKCWGDNYAGQLGDGTTTRRLAPVDVSDLTSGVASISSGGYHTCALTTGGSAKCWGDNGHGQLGDGTDTNRSTPVSVTRSGPQPGFPAEITVTAQTLAGSISTTVVLTVALDTSNGVFGVMAAKGYPMTTDDPASGCCANSTTTDGNFGLVDTAGGSSLRFKPSSIPGYWSPSNSTEELAFRISREHVANILGHKLHAAGYKWGANNGTHIFFKCVDPAEHAAAVWPNCPNGGQAYTFTMWAGYGSSYAYLQDLFF